jgi:hypothetical protein
MMLGTLADLGFVHIFAPLNLATVMFSSKVGSLLKTYGIIFTIKLLKIIHNFVDFFKFQSNGLQAGSVPEHVNIVA